MKIFNFKVYCNASRPERHTSKALAKALHDIILEWELEDKVLMVVTDNASNIKKAEKEEFQLKHLSSYHQPSCPKSLEANFSAIAKFLEQQRKECNSEKRL